MIKSIFRGVRNSMINQKTRMAKDFLSRDLFIPTKDTQENDVFIVGFPKSGNTWMQSLISGLVFGIDTEYLPPALAHELVPDLHARRFYKRYDNNAYFKWHGLPEKRMRRVIYIVRDGRDSMVSYYAMQKTLGHTMSFKEMIVEGKGIYPCKWNKHVNEWLENPFNSNLITVRYEDLINQPQKELEKICSFLDIQRTETQLDRVVKGASFNKAQAKAKKYNKMGHHEWDSGNIEKFYRKGKVGSYKEEMPAELLLQFNKEAEKELKLLGYQI